MTIKNFASYHEQSKTRFDVACISEGRHLRVMIKHYLPDLYQKIVALGFSLENFFAEHLLTYAAGLLNTPLFARVLDIAFAAPVSPQSVILAILMLNRSLLIEASDYKAF